MPSLADLMFAARAPEEPQPDQSISPLARLMAGDDPRLQSAIAGAGQFGASLGDAVR